MKGTEFILAGLEQLRARGLEFDVDLVEGVRHEELLSRVAKADIVVEKLLGGDAGVGTLEAMAMGKVAVARIRDEVRLRQPDLPVVSADPETFPDVMEELLRSPQRRAELGAKGREYVVARHDAAVVAGLLEELYSGIVPRGRPAAAHGWTAPALDAQLEQAHVKIEELKRANARLRAKLEDREAELSRQRLLRQASRE